MSSLNVSTALPTVVWQLVQLVGSIAADTNIAAYIVGGFVRDVLLGVDSNDIDIVFEGDATEVAQAVEVQLGGTLVIHKSFGTATWTPSAETWKKLGSPLPYPDLPGIDFVTARREIYEHVAALPTVTPSTIDDDLQRRDFSINTLAIRLNGAQAGELYDYLGGQADLENQLIRVLHDKSFADDPTRIFRTVRYAQRLNFSLDEATQQQLQQAIPHIDALSSARVWHELEKIVAEPARSAILGQLNERGVLAQISANFRWQLDWEAQLEQGVALANSASWQETNADSTYLLIWLALHPTEAQKAIQQRLATTGYFDKCLAAVNALVVGLGGISAESPPSTYDQLIHPYRQLPDALLAAYAITNADAIMRYRTAWQTLEPFLNGNDLRQMGLTPGPQFKTILTQLRAEQIDGKLKNKAEAAARVSLLL